MRNTVIIQMQLQKEFDPIVCSYFLALKPPSLHSSLKAPVATVLYSASWMVGGQCYVHPK